MAIDTEFAPPSPVGGARTLSPTLIRAQETPSPPSKRQRRMSTPPPNPGLPSPPRRRSFSAPPSSPTRGGISSEDKAMAAASQSSPNRLMTCRTKLDYAPENGQPGPVAIFWDIENCPVPKDAEPRDVSSHVRRALGKHHNFSGTVTKFCAYGDFSFVPTRVKEGLQGSGVQVVHVSHEQKKEAAKKAILVQMLFFAMDNGVPSSIMLISGDAVFALVLQGLHKRRHTIAIAIPSAIHVASDLTMAAEVVLDWPSLARGKGVGIPRPLACPGDLQALKGEMMQLLKSTEDGSLKVSEIPGAYQKHFLRPLIVSHYDVTQLDELFKKLGCDFLLSGARASMVVCLNTNPALEEVEQLGSSSEEVKVTDMGDLHEDQVTTDTVVPTSVIDDGCVECVNTEDVDAPMKDEGVEVGASSQATLFQSCQGSVDDDHVDVDF